MKDDDTLFDPATRDRVRQDLARGTIAVFVVVTLLFGIVSGVLHREMPFLARMTGQCGPDQYAYECDTVAYDALAGFLGFVAFGLLAAVVYRYRRIPATVRCESCGGRGWVMDLEACEGRCPRCAGQYFSYQTNLPGAHGLGPLVHRVEEEHVQGHALVTRFRKTRKSLFDRYY